MKKKAKTHNKGTDGDKIKVKLSAGGRWCTKPRAPFGAISDHRLECKLTSAMNTCVTHGTCWLVGLTRGT